MNSGASWNDRGLSPELYQAAREAAKRAGMSVDDWLNSTFGSPSAPPSDKADRDARPRSARLSDTVARLNARLEQLTARRPSPDADRETDSPARDHSPPSDHSPPPEGDTPGLEQIIAEIVARQSASPVPAQPAATAPDLSSLERQLTHITAQIESLRRPCGMEDAVAALRQDLAEIARALNEALPRRALESLRADVHALAERIELGYGGGADPSALQSIEHRLSEVQSALNAMRPAESLAGFDERISELSRKMDGIAGGSADPELLHYLESAINELREFSTGVASAEGVASLAGDVQALSARIDHISTATAADGLDSLAQRVGALTEALDTRAEHIGSLPPNIEALVASLTDKLDRPDPFTRDQTTLEQLERRIAGLAEKIEASEQRSGTLDVIERGIEELTQQVREAREEAIATAERVARAVAADMPRDDGEVAAFKRDLETLHAHQAETDQRTRDTLDAVHETLQRLVERLASVETGMRGAAPRAAEPSTVPALTREPTAPLRAAEPPPPHGEAPPLPAPRPNPPFMHVPRGERQPIDPDLPADTPLEPGTGAARGRSPAERIAASEAALGSALGTLKQASEVTGRANFIAAARRAAQAAANEGVVEGPRSDEHKAEERPSSLIGRFLANRRRALMLGVSALLVLYGTIHVVGMFGADAPARLASSQIRPPEPRKLAAPTPAPAPAPVAAPAAVASVADAPPAPPPAAEPARVPEPPSRPSAAPQAAPAPTASLMAPPAVAAPAPAPAAEVTGTVKPPLNLAALAAKPAEPAQASPEASAADKLPAAIGGPALRAAVAAGNPDAEYEVGVRYSEGRGVPVNLELAAQWFESAARRGLPPAQYRLGSLYEKGQGVKKDLNKARQLYVAAAEKGNAKAIHNLAVLYAEGIDGKPDYQTASQWFRKAAQRGVADSQYNLGILYARGIGVDQNLAESYKWFALAAAQGDQDAAKKRDDVAARLDQQSLVAARLAVQTWAADPPPDEAMNVKVPPGGWDGAAAKPGATARRTKRQAS